MGYFCNAMLLVDTWYQRERSRKSEGIRLSFITLISCVPSGLNSVLRVAFLCDVVMDDARANETPCAGMALTTPLWVVKFSILRKITTMLVLDSGRAHAPLLHADVRDGETNP